MTRVLYRARRRVDARIRAFVSRAVVSVASFGREVGAEDDDDARASV
jgi:hypothetical protein|tara:strand:- start:16744 stop:16884 length:141 start_codon:yes stop_codon:yes gene_type:complete